ncbi:carboxypeptidase regulatory-like domain-containing protein [Lacinutrix iliipiscaria]|uniref:Carboxypeptidase regulatory-like domain-containing protein n=1 Tax=Lacinutrix iliipiscaria TaxID=1230532 RepID=A0ABW5WLI5_9FLAO
MKNLLTLLFFIVVSTTFAQVRVEGVVKDSIGNPLELANVVAINQATLALDSYGITNDAGRYKLALEKNTSYKIQVSYIGMVTAEDYIDTKEEDLTRNYNLLDDNTLDEVELIYEMPVTVKGDTLIYNADSFKTGTEKKLEDVLKKLPGVEINDDGEIEVEGKKVSKIMVEGKDFFDGDTKLASKNIPSDAVDKVQVLKNFSEVGQLSSVTNNQDNVAINLKLKEGKNKFWFGDVTVGAGVAPDEGLYKVQPKLFYYSPTTSINFIGDMNNTGEVAFTRRDYFNFTGGFRNFNQSSGTNISLGDNSLNFLNTTNNRAENIDIKFGAANFSYSPNKALTISGFGIYSGNETDIRETNDITYTNDELNIPDESTTSFTEQKSDLALLKLSTVYKPNANNQLDYDIFGRLSKQTQNRFFNSTVLGQVNQIEDQTPYSINQNLNYYYTLNDSNIFSFEVQHLLQDEDPFYNAFIEQKATYESTADNLGFDDSQSAYDAAQDKRVKSNKFDARLNYWNVLNQKSNLNYTLGLVSSSQQFDSQIFQILDDDSEFLPTPVEGTNTNDVSYRFTDAYFGLHYNLKAGKFTITPGFSAHAYNTKDEQFGTSNSNSFFRVLPDANIRFQIKKSESLNLRYSMQTNFTDVSKLAEGLVMNNYNSLFSGNRELENSLSHNLNLSYFSFNMFNYTNVFAFLNYSKSVDAIQNITNFNSVITTSSPFNSNFANESFSARGRFERRFGKIKANLSGSWSWSVFNQFIGGNVSENTSFTQTYGTRISTFFKEAPNVEMGYDLTINDNDQGNRTTKFYTHRPFINLDAVILKDFRFFTEYSYYDFRDQDDSLNAYSFWDASLIYQKTDSKWEYKLGATNLLDTESLSQSNTGSVSVSNREYFIQPRYLVLSVKYNL